MNGKQYNNVIDWTLKHEQSAQTEDSLAIARAIFDNMGVALPNGSMKEVYDILRNNNYMSWKSCCTMQEAQQAADSGMPAIGISENRIVVLSAADEEEPVTEAASVMALSENTSAYAVSDLQYYLYGAGSIVLPTRTVNGWLKLYTAPTISGRVVSMPPGCQPGRWYAFENRNKINSYAQSAINGKNRVEVGAKGELYDKNGRYWVAVGPKVMNPSHSNCEAVLAEEMKYGSRIEAKLKDYCGKTYYLRAVVGDCKNHTYSNGIYQTGYAFPSGKEFASGHVDGSVIEFCGATLPTGLSNFYIESITVEE